MNLLRIDEFKDSLLDYALMTIPVFNDLNDYKRFFIENIHQGILRCKYKRKINFTDKLQTLVQDNLFHYSDSLRNKNIKTQLSYILGELIDNIEDHSMALNGSLSMIYSESEDCLYICVGDNGQTIKGTYESKAEDPLFRIAANDTAMALKFSTEGLSTKELPQHRGYGLSTSIEMIVRELGGSFMILSGSGFFISEESESDIIQLPDNMEFDGTMILIKMPVKEIGNNKLYNIISH